MSIRDALDMAEDEGLADLSRIIRGGRKHLVAGGWLLLEHGFQQGLAVRELLAEAGYTDVSMRQDLAGLERVTGGRWQSKWRCR